MKTQIADLQSIVNGLYKQRNLGLLGKDDKMSLEKYEKKLGELEKEMKRVKQNQENQQKFCQRRKRKFAALDEDIKKKLGMQPKVGRPPVTDDNILVQSITDIALAGSAAMIEEGQKLSERSKAWMICTSTCKKNLEFCFQEVLFICNCYSKTVPRQKENVM